MNEYVINIQAKYTQCLKEVLLCLAVGFCLLATLISPLAQAENFFKIKNEEGHTEIKETLTPTEARRGYEIISSTGRVIESVEPELSDEEYAVMSEAEKIAMLKEENEEREARYNLSLLLKYSNLDDLAAERKRKLGEFDISISILRGNLAVLRENAERQRSRAASIERNNHAVPEKLQQNIEEIEREMNEALASITARQEEKQVAINKYDTDAQRLELLFQKKKITAKS